MDLKVQALKNSISVEISCQNRWAIYRRLQELDIDCDCSTYKALKVKVDTVEKLFNYGVFTTGFPTSTAAHSAA